MNKKELIFAAAGTLSANLCFGMSETISGTNVIAPQSSMVTRTLKAATKEESGILLFRENDKAGAVSLLHEVVDGAPEGETPVAAAYILGNCYRLGDGVKQNMEQAMHYYALTVNSNKKSAIIRQNEQNLAAYELGNIYFNGLYGIPKDIERGVDLLSLACRNENIYTYVPVARAAMMLGGYHYDLGNVEEARRCYRIIPYSISTNHCMHWRWLGIDKFPNAGRYSEFPIDYSYLENRDDRLSDTLRISIDDFVKGIYRAYVTTLQHFGDRYDDTRNDESRSYLFAKHLACSNAFDVLGKESPLQAIRGDLLFKLALVLSDYGEEGRVRENLLRDAAELDNTDAMFELAKQLFTSLPAEQNANAQEIKDYIVKALSLQGEVSSFVDLLSAEKQKLIEALYDRTDFNTNGKIKKKIRITQILDILSVVDQSFADEKTRMEVLDYLQSEDYDAVKQMRENERQIEVARETVLGFYNSVQNSLQKLFDQERKMQVYVSKIFVCSEKHGPIRCERETRMSFADQVVHHLDQIQELKDAFDIE